VFCGSKEKCVNLVRLLLESPYFANADGRCVI
jgi:hypothetical protein